MIIAVSRQLGSGGASIGRQLAARLGFKYVDRYILDKAAEQLGEDAELLAKREEKLSGFWENQLKSFSVGSPEAPSEPHPIPLVTDRELFEAQAAIIRGIAERYDAVIIGRCGALILDGMPGLIKVFVHGGTEYRVRRLMEHHGVASRDDALAVMTESDAQREKFVRSLTAREWADARNYHLCIDAEVSGFPLAVDVIAGLIERMRSFSSGEAGQS
jgi:cytidylate kinase